MYLMSFENAFAVDLYFCICFDLCFPLYSGGGVLSSLGLRWISTDWIGVGTLVIGTMIGLMAPRIGIRRSHGMGVILVPIMIYTFARELDAFGFA